MCLLTLESSNPQFSYIINKNPASGMSVRDMRSGRAFGYFNENNLSQYVIYFNDADNKISYKLYAAQEFEYLNHLKYTSPIFVLNAIHEFFNDNHKKKNDDDTDGFVNSLCVLSVHIQQLTFNTIKKLDSFFSDFTIDCEKKITNTFKVTISTKKSIKHLINFAIMYFGIISCMNENDLDLTDSGIERIITAINQLAAPYYVRYIFASRVMGVQRNFKKFKNILQAPNTKMCFGNTAMQRRDHIQSLILFDKPIIDIGCGDGFYAIPFAQKLKGLIYHAVDIDNDCLISIIKKAKKNGITNIATFKSHNELALLDKSKSYDIIISEVVEHMEEKESADIIKFVLDNIPFNKIIITTPNYEFNKHYQIEGFRHFDHKWEYTRPQFESYMRKILENYKFGVTFIGMGDTVDGSPVTQGVVITQR